jgi:hypothetical protein
MMDSQYSKKWKQVKYLFKWKVYPEKEDCTEESYENFNDKRLLMEYHRRNPHGTKDNWIIWLSYYLLTMKGFYQLVRHLTMELVFKSTRGHEYPTSRERWIWFLGTKGHIFQIKRYIWF